MVAWPACNSGNLAVERTSNLGAIAAEDQKEGATAWVEFEDSWYSLILDPVRLAALNTTTPAGNNAVVSNPLGGFWFRRGQADLRQRIYHLDEALGSDTNLGILSFADAAAGPGAKYGPIKTPQLLFRRIGDHDGAMPQKIDVFVHGNSTNNWLVKVANETATADPTNAYETLNIRGVIPAPLVTALITASSVPAGTGIMEITTALALLEGDILQITAGANPGAMARVLGAGTGGPGTFQIIPFETDGQVIVGFAALVGQTIGVVLPPIIDGEFRVDASTTVNLFGFVQQGQLALIQGIVQFINTLAKGSQTGLLNIIADNAVAISSGFWQLSTPLLVTGEFESFRSLFTGAAGVIARGGGRVELLGSTTAVGARHIGNATVALPISAANRSYLTADAGGVVQIGQPSNGSGLWVTNGALTGVWQKEGGLVDQLSNAANTVPLGTVLAGGEGVRIESKGGYIIRDSRVPAIVPATVGNEVNVGGRMCLYSEMVALGGLVNGENVPSVQVRANLITAGANQPVFAAPYVPGTGTYGISFAQVMAANPKPSVTVRGAAFAGFTATVTSIVGAIVTVQVSNAAGVGADGDFDLDVRSTPNDASMVIRAPTA